MALQEELELQGNWLFRYRSILPITILSIGVLVYIYTIHAPGTLFNKIEFYWHHYENLCLFYQLQQESLSGCTRSDTLPPALRAETLKTK